MKRCFTLTGAIIEKHRASYQPGKRKKGIDKGLCSSPNLSLFFLIEKDTESDISASQIVCRWLG